MFRCFVGESGIDVARAIYLDMTGQPIVPSQATEGRKWVVESIYLLSSFRYYRDRNLSLRQWRGSLRGIKEYTYLDRDDPWPAASIGERLARQVWSKVLRGSESTPPRSCHSRLRSR